VSVSSEDGGSASGFLQLAAQKPAVRQHTPQQHGENTLLSQSDMDLNFTSTECIHGKALVLHAKDMLYVHISPRQRNTAILHFPYESMKGVH